MFNRDLSFVCIRQLAKNTHTTQNASDDLYHVVWCNLFIAGYTTIIHVVLLFSPSIYISFNYRLIMYFSHTSLYLSV